MLKDRAYSQLLATKVVRLGFAETLGYLGDRILWYRSDRQVLGQLYHDRYQSIPYM